MRTRAATRPPREPDSSAGATVAKETATRTTDQDRGPQHGLHGWVIAHPVAAYALLAYAVSWALWTPIVVGGGGPVVVVLFFLGVLGPAASALVIGRLVGADLRLWARQIVKWRVPARYYLYALGLPALLFAVVNLELAVAGQGIDLGRLSDRLPAYLGSFLLVLTIGGGLEEPGWRGFALPRLQEHHAPVKATLILGLLWATWHLPLYGAGAVGPMLFVFFYTWLYNKTGSVLLCILLHASFTPALDHLVLREDDLGVDVAILTTLVVAVLAIIALTKGRLGYAGATDPSDATP
jgi:membrane protease YdiL (CAAX protease family)